jgi:hypothetical protein
MKRTIAIAGLLFGATLPCSLVAMGDEAAAPAAGAAVEKAAPAAPADAEAVKPYPLSVCIVSDEKLGSMGKTPSLVHEGQEFKFCCRGCIKDFNKDPAKFVTKLQDEVKKKDAAK